MMGYPPLNTRKQKERQNKNLTTPAFLCYLDFTFSLFTTCIYQVQIKGLKMCKNAVYMQPPPQKISKIT